MRIVIQNFTAVVQELRKSLGAENEISFAAGGVQKFIDEAIEWEKVMPLVDRLNLMSYDLVNGNAVITGHHTALYSTAMQKESADNGIKALLQKGVPANKIVMGAAFYGRAWEAVPATNNGLYGHGKFKTTVGYKDFGKEFSKQKGFVSYWDEEAKAPYLYSADQKVFVTYDDPRSLTEKSNYIIEKGLNGIMFWELTLDLSTNGLLDAIDKTIKHK